MPDLDDLLERAAPAPAGPPPVDAIVRRGRRRARTTQVLVAGAALLAVLVAASLLPDPAPRLPVVDDGPDDGAAATFPMQPGFEGPDADVVAQRMDRRAILGSAAVLTWSENGFGRAEVVQYRISPSEGDVDRGEDLGEDLASAERAVSDDAPVCIAVSEPDGISSSANCIEPGPEPNHVLMSRGRLWSTIYCEGEVREAQLGVPEDAAEVVLDLVTDRTLVVRPHRGLVYVRYPGLWGSAERSRAYDADGTLLAIYQHETSEPSGSSETGCDSAASNAAWHASASIEVDGDRQGTFVAERAQSVQWPEDPAGVVEAELVSLDEGVALRLHLPREEVDPPGVRASVWLPTVDLADPFPRYDPVGGTGCTGDLRSDDAGIEGTLRCDLVSPAGETIQATIALTLEAPAG
jgi:hypothetical protein